MKERSFRGLFWGLALLGTTLDQVSKYGIFRWLYNGGEGDQHEVWPGVFRLVATYTRPPVHDAGTGWLAPLRTWSGDVQPLVNHGALFGLGSEYYWMANFVFAVVSIIAAVAIMLWTLRRTTARDWALCAALGLILAGTLGNLYDRAIFGGVRDFLHFYWIEWPVFNVADCCLVSGACVLLAHAFWAQPETVEKPAATPGVAVPEMIEAK
jgi:lipoprotein signal peptidase